MLNDNDKTEAEYKVGTKVKVRKNSIIYSLHPQEPNFKTIADDLTVKITRIDPTVYKLLGTQYFAPHRRRRDKFLISEIQFEEIAQSLINPKYSYLDLSSTDINIENIHEFFIKPEKVYCYRENVPNIKHYFKVHYCYLENVGKIYWAGRGGYWYGTHTYNIKKIL